ncbi:hypothetical protein BDQ17DRAFT_1242023 [Cyathus striatus]|nr:hypothetical protein BDQ17DRAFT_1242023 [Cyathus striatus]
MSGHDIEPFWGDCNHENPEDFFRAFQRRMGAHTDEHKCTQFILYLYSDSAADKWYESLPSEDKTSWAKLSAAFQKRWPKKIVAEKTELEYEEEIMGCKLKIKELLKKEVVAGREVYKYITWADHMLNITMGAKIATGTTYLNLVWKNLPQPIWDQTTGSYDSWIAFLDAVQKVNIDSIREKVDEHEERKKAIEEMQKRIAALELPATAPGITRAGASTARHIVQAAAPRTRGGNAIANTNRSQPETLTEQELTILQVNYTVLPHHPNTPAGHAAHQAQQQEFVRQHGTSVFIKYDTPYPLRPGTAGINTGECYKCGTTGHQSLECTDRTPLHTYEQKWCRYAGFHLRQQ